MSLSRKSAALVLTTRNKETKHHIHPKHKKETKKLPELTKQTTGTPWFDTPFTTSGQRTQQPYSYNPGAYMDSTTHANTHKIFLYLPF